MFPRTTSRVQSCSVCCGHENFRSDTRQTTYYRVKRFLSNRLVPIPALLNSRRDSSYPTSTKCNVATRTDRYGIHHHEHGITGHQVHGEVCIVLCVSTVLHVLCLSVCSSLISFASIALTKSHQIELSQSRHSHTQDTHPLRRRSQYAPPLVHASGAPSPKHAIVCALMLGAMQEGQVRKEKEKETTKRRTGRKRPSLSERLRGKQIRENGRHTRPW